jgi:hypothetical protein
MIVIRSAGASSLARPGLHGPEQWPDRDRIVAGIGRYSGQRGLDPHLWRGKEGCCSGGMERPGGFPSDPGILLANIPAGSRSLQQEGAAAHDVPP